MKTLYSTESTYFWIYLPKTFTQRKTVSGTGVNDSHGFLKVKGKCEFRQMVPVSHLVPEPPVTLPRGAM